MTNVPNMIYDGEQRSDIRWLCTIHLVTPTKLQPNSKTPLEDKLI
jgi:hypothetical protein